MSEVNWSTVTVDNTTRHNVFLSINTSFSLIATKVFFAYLSLFSGFILLYICYERILCISHDFLDMLFCLILCDMLTVTGIINGCFNFVGLEELDLTDACAAAFFCEGHSMYSSYFYVAGQLWTIAIESCCFFVMAKNSVTFSLSNRSKIVLHVIFWTTPGIICGTAFVLGAFGFSTSRTASTFCWITSCSQTLSRTQQFIWMMLTGKGLDIVVYLSVVNLVFMVFFLKTRKERRRALEWANFDSASSEPQFRVMTSTLYGAFPSVEGAGETLSAEELQNALDPGWRMFVWIPLCYLISRVWGTVRFWFDAYELFHYSLPIVFQKVNATFLYLQAIGDGSIATYKFIMVLILRKEARRFCAAPFRKLKAFIDRRMLPVVILNADNVMNHSQAGRTVDSSTTSQQT